MSDNSDYLAYRKEMIGISEDISLLLDSLKLEQNEEQFGATIEYIKTLRAERKRINEAWKAKFQESELSHE